jgi:hypothetical protein
MNATALLQLVSGKKTYLTVIAVAVLLFGDWQHWWAIPNDVYLALMAAAVAFLRAGIAKGPDAPPAVNATAPATSATSSMKLPLMLAFACLALTTAVVLDGCQTTPQQVTYEAAGTATVSVDTAMSLWGTYVATNHPPVAQELAVQSAYQKYQAAMATACDAGAIYAASSVTNSAAGSSAASLALQQAIATAGQELADLETLITSFGVKL